MKVAVIGAGGSGLIVMKELIDEGHEPEAFEAFDSLGGVFYYQENKGGVYDSTLLTISNYFMAFSIFPPKEGEKRKFWTFKEYYDYLVDFANHFDLNKFINFNSKVVHVEVLPSEVILTIEKKDGNTYKKTFDAVAICTGTHQHPKSPHLPGEEKFKGTIAHSYNYKNAKPYVGKRVVCIGMGETGADVAHEICNVSEDCILSLRHYPAVIERYPRIPFGKGMETNDAYASRYLHTFPKEFWQYNTVKTAKKYIKEDEKTCQVDKVLCDWDIRCRGRLSQFLTKNAIFIKDISDGRLKVNVSGIKCLNEDEVIFNDGTKFKADVIMCNTGYQDKFEFLDLKITNVRDLFKHAFHPDLGHRVAFIGWARPAVGGVPTCSEMISRYFALLLSGKVKLPEKEELKRIIHEDRLKEEQRYKDTPNIKTIVHYVEYWDSLSKLIGCYPLRWRLIFHPFLFWKLWFGSLIACQYRLYGPHSDFKLAKKTIMSLPIGFSFSELVGRIIPSFLSYNFNAYKSFLRKKYHKLLHIEVDDYIKNHGGESTSP